MRKKYILAAFLILIYSFAEAKSIPENMRFYPNSSLIRLSYQPGEGLYNLNSVDTIYLIFKQSDWWQQLTNNYKAKVDIEATLKYKGITYEGVGVRFRGNTSYQKVQNSKKKSFNISMDFINPGQSIQGYKTLNLNNGFEDPTFMREILYSCLAGHNAPIARSNFIKLVINGENWGIYSNVQQLNDEFYNDWFMSADGTSWRAEFPDTSTKKPRPPNPSFGSGVCSLNYLSDEPIVYSSYYQLKSTSKEEPWFDLMFASKMLNQVSPDRLYDSLKNYIDIDRSLWHIANEIIFSDDDGYITKGGMDYFVYYDVETGRIQPIEFDGNNTFLSRNNNLNLLLKEKDTSYPLMYRLMQNQDLKQRYLAHARHILNTVDIPEQTSKLIDSFNSLIESEVQTDTKKLMSWDAYLTGITELKNIIQTRRNVLLGHSELKELPPVISVVSYSSPGGKQVAPKGNERALVQAGISSASGISKVRLYYVKGLMGTFNTVAMYDDGKHDDLDSNDGIYAAYIPSIDAGTFVRFYVEANANNQQKSAAYNPPGAEHDVYFYQVATETAVVKTVVLNELMASNTATIADPQGEYDDWIELYNLTNLDIDLTGCYMTDKIDNLKKWQFPDGTIIGKNSYLIVWADENGKATPGLHTNFKLSAAGELVMLVDNDNNGNRILDSISFGFQQPDISYGRYPNGTGSFDFLNPTPLMQNIKEIGVSDESNNDLTINLFPNPAVTSSRIMLDVGIAGDYRVSVYNYSGVEVSVVSPRYLSSGRHLINWECSDIRGNSLPSGIYLVKVTNGLIVKTKTLVIAR